MNRPPPTRPLRALDVGACDTVTAEQRVPLAGSPRQSRVPDPTQIKGSRTGLARLRRQRGASRDDAARRRRRALALNTGYRAYDAEMVQKRADFQGFPLAPDQAYVLVVGRVP